MSGFTIEVTTTGASESVTLPLVAGYTYDCTVDWDDGSPVSVTAWDDADATHVYATPGTYTVEITGACPAWSVNSTHSSKLQWTAIVYWGDAVDFDGWQYLTGGWAGCSNLTSLGSGSIISDGLTSLQSCWYNCTSLTTIPSGLLDNCTALTNMYDCWRSCTSLTTIPSGLLDNCTVLTHLSNCWYNCTSLTTIPSGLLDNCTALDRLNYCWYNCSSLTTIPSGLLDNCTVLTYLSNCWRNCTKLELDPWIFYQDGEQDTKFLNRTVDFSHCFQITSFTGVQGQAPDLWNCEFGTGSPTATDCFDGHSTPSLKNWKNIPGSADPVDWGGDVVSAPTITLMNETSLYYGLPVTLTVTDALPYQYDGKVEVVDNATYGSGTIFEEWEITSWADTSIAAIVSRGDHPIGSTAYVFLTTDRGDQTATPYTVYFNKTFVWIQRSDGSISAYPHAVVLI